MLICRSRFLTRGEVWFDDQPDATPVDWIYYRQRSSPMAKGRWKYFYTLLIDLARSPSELLSEMDAKTVRKIKEAQERDKTRWQRRDPKESRIMDEVEETWNRHAASWNGTRLDRDWLNQIIAAGALDLSVATDPRGKVLTYHLAYVGTKRAQQLIIVSPCGPSPNAAMRNAINRANCFGHWNSFLAYKERGIRHFDFGGWYPGTMDMRLLGMNAFKKSFGGQVVREYEGRQILTLKSWVVLTTARILKQARGLRASLRPETRNTTDATTKDYSVSPAF